MWRLQEGKEAYKMYSKHDAWELRLGVLTFWDISEAGPVVDVVEMVTERRHSDLRIDLDVSVAALVASLRCVRL
jgi:hypothetical protein